MMKKILTALMCIAVGLFWTACDPNNPGNPGNPTNPIDPSEDAGLDQWQRVLKHIKPGIYRGLSDEELNAGMSMGYDKCVLAVCGDGTGFYIKDIETSNPIPEIIAYDNDLTFYTISSSEPQIGVYNYDKKITVYSREQLEGLSTSMCDIAKQRQFYAINFGFSEYQTGTMIGNCFRKIDDAPDFKTAYEKIFNYVMTKGEYVPFENLFIYEHTIFGNGWHSELYPSDMDAKSWVIPYRGKGKIERFSVYRQRNWTYDPKWYMFYGPCNYELVTYVECDLICEEADAIEWFNKVTAEAKYNYVYENQTGIVKSWNNEDEVVSVGYNYSCTDEGMDLEGYNGYVHPFYEMLWEAYFKQMTIKFGVGWVTFV